MGSGVASVTKPPEIVETLCLLALHGFASQSSIWIYQIGLLWLRTLIASEQIYKYSFAESFRFRFEHFTSAAVLVTSLMSKTSEDGFVFRTLVSIRCQFVP